MPKQLLFLVLAALSAQFAWAQQFFTRQAEKSLWHYSNFLPSRGTAQKLEIGDTAQGRISQPSTPHGGEQRRRNTARINRPRLGRMLTHCGQPLDICSCFLPQNQVNLFPSGYRCNLSIASKSARGLEL